jgi:hypothetical protein
MHAGAEGSSASRPDALPLREPARQPDMGRQGGDSQKERTDGEVQQAARAERLKRERCIMIRFNVTGS